MLPTIVRRTAQATVRKTAPYIYTNPHKAKHTWPPDFSNIHPKHQFRLERKFKRRTKLKWARPRWTKAVKLVQFGSIVFVTIYGVLFLDWNDATSVNPSKPPFYGVRKWFFGLVDSIWSREDVRRRPEGPDDSSPVARPGN
ncbi:hypothetical protein HYFRA_00000069 [Hymenoscyphus fraxineus]|uniref:Transmembrane protein n=1 Tax=Hymenoscyphus fraxineus TaxID=746836 RepID=A0A9N9L406_9HELO|nr:hypothetical protein HYFRA_00000069 [Hymenoscyphus fraxineus]